MSKFNVELQNAIALALKMTNERLEKVPNYIIYQAIHHELTMIQTALDTNTKLAPEVKRKMNFGYFAAREIHNDDEYAEALHKAYSLSLRW